MHRCSSSLAQASGSSAPQIDSGTVIRMISGSARLSYCGEHQVDHHQGGEEAEHQGVAFNCRESDCQSWLKPAGTRAYVVEEGHRLAHGDAGRRIA